MPVGMSSVESMKERLERRKAEFEKALAEVNGALDALVAYPNIEALINQFRGL